MKILITGSSGYIGYELVKNFSKSNNYVYSDFRNKADVYLKNQVYFNINEYNDFNIPEDTELIIYLAYLKDSNENEIKSIEYFCKHANKIKIPLIFFSTQSSYSESKYVKNKFAAENIILKYKQFIIRCSFVYGRSCKGQFGKIISLLNLYHIFPYFIPSPRFQLVHIDDVVDKTNEIVNKIFSKKITDNIFCISSNEIISFNIFLINIRKFWVSRFLLFPILIFNYFLYPLAFFKFSKKYHDSLISLYKLKDNHFDAKKIYGKNYIKFFDGIKINSKILHRKQLLEGYIILKYFYNQHPDLKMLKKYISFVNKKRITKTIRFKFIYILIPFFIIDNSPEWIKRKFQLIEKISICSRIAEFTKYGSKLYLFNNRISLLSLLFLGLRISLLKILGILFSPLLFIIYE